MLGSLFQIFLYQPLLNLLVLVCAFLPGHDLGLAIIILTILIRLLLYPLFLKSLRAQKVMNELQPKLEELRQRYKKDTVKQSQELMALYKQHHINPLSNLLLLLIQLPILIALFRVFSVGFDPASITPLLYSFVSLPTIEPTLLGFLSLTQPSLVLALIASLAQFYQGKMSLAQVSSAATKNKTLGFTQKSMTYFLPLLTFLLLTGLNAAIGLYWLTTTLFSIGQQYFLLHPLKLSSFKK
jgi:YidC/Oxa1 family membrane protein insertase